MSEQTELELVNSPSAERLANLQSSLKGYNVEKIGAYDADTLAVFAMVGGEELGGAYGAIKLGWLWVEWLFVCEEERKKGYATRLLRGLEEAARTRGVERSRLNTAKFQGAVPFYLKQEYQVVFEYEIELPGGETNVDYVLEKSL